MKKLLLLLALLLGFSVTCHAQGGVIEGPALSNTGRPLSGATITVCLAGATVTNGICSPTVTVFTDYTLNTPITPPVGGGSLVADAYGNFQAWVSPGQYEFSVSGHGIFSQTYPRPVACVPGASACPSGASSMAPTNSVQLSAVGGSFAAGPLISALPLLASSNAFSGALNTFIALNAQNLESVRFADQFTGADWCAKVTAADTSLGSNYGEIWINNAAGTSACAAAPTFSSFHTLRFIQAGIYHLGVGWTTVSTAINYGIVGVPGTILQFDGSAGMTVLGTGVGNLAYGILLDNIIFSGNGSIANALTINGVARSTFINIGAINSTGPAMYLEGSLLNTFILPKCSSNEFTWTATPTGCMYFTQNGASVPSNNNVIIDVVAEGVNGPGVEVNWGEGNSFQNGTSEGNTGANGYGIVLDLHGFNTKLDSLDLEDNAAGDAKISSSGNVFENVQAQTLTSGVPNVHLLSGATFNVFIGGLYNTMTFDSGANNNSLSYLRYGTFGTASGLTNNGTNNWEWSVYNAQASTWDTSNVSSLMASFLSSASANPAQSGVLRLSNTDAISWRNAANSGDLPLGVNGSNQLTFGGAVICSSLPCGSGGGGSSLFTSFQLNSNTAITGTGSYLQMTTDSNFSPTYTGSGTSGSPFTYTLKLSSTAALPNGVTATTQSVSDNTTKVATDAFVLANALTNPMTTAGDIIYGGASGVATRLAGPSAVTGLNYSLTSAGSTPAWGIVGIPVSSAQTGTYTFNGAGASGTGSSADQGELILANPSAARVYTIPAAGGTGFANNPFWPLYNENATYAVTLTPGTSTINGNATQIVPPHWFAPIYSDNTNYFSPVLPTIVAFPGCNTGALQFTTATGIISCNASPTFTAPALGAATTTSLIASGIVDGQAPVTVTTGSSASLGGTYSSGYTFNQEATAATAVTYSLPTAAHGLQYCIANSYNGSAGDTGTLKLATSASGQYIIYNGVLSATGGYIISAGALGDKGCVVGVDATHWEFIASAGTWVLH